MMNDVEEQEGKSFGEYIAIVKRRQKWIKITAAAVFVLGLLAAFFWPASYRSTAVILIESQDIPQDLIKSTITSYAVQRIEEIKQRIMTTSNIMSVVERFELYDKNEMNRMTRSEIAKKFRDNVIVQPISADVIDPRSGNPTKAVIAFSLSYDGRESQKVYKVSNELVTLYLNENLRGRAEQSNSTSDFLGTEAKSLNESLKDLEAKLASFKEENKGSLPELNTFNLSVLDRSEHELTEIKTRMQDLETRKIELASQLAQMNPSSPTILADGKAVLSDTDRLKALQSEYRAKSAIYNSDHPDLARLNREIQALEASKAGNNESRGLSKQLQTAKEQLAQAKLKYTAEHPEISRLKELVADLEKEQSTLLSGATETIPDNPSYVLISTQLKSVASEIESLKSKYSETKVKIKLTENQLLKAPSVEKNYQALLRDYENTRLKYREISEKQMAAELGKNLETERKGERFTLIQPPEIPEEPLSPNRMAIIVIAVLLAIGAGLAAAVITEALDPKVHGEQAITKITGLSTLVVIPFFAPPSEIKNSKKMRLSLIIYFIAGGIIALTIFHFFIKPLDVMWYYTLHKLGLN